MIFDTICDKMASNPGFLRRDHGNVRRVWLATDAQEQVMRLQINLKQNFLIFFLTIQQWNFCINQNSMLSFSYTAMDWWLEKYIRDGGSAVPETSYTVEYMSTLHILIYDSSTLAILL